MTVCNKVETKERFKSNQTFFLIYKHLSIIYKTVELLSGRHNPGKHIHLYIL